MDVKKRELLKRIEALMRYDDSAETTIEPSLLKYLDETALQHLINSLEKRRKNLLEEEREWLSRFRKEELS